MPHTQQMQDYLKFMEWFQDSHPDLYVCCWKDIAIPTDGEGVTVIKDGMNADTYKQVINATQEYYQQENK